MATQPEIRSVAPGDLDRVVTIDHAITGRLRRGFYDKRFAALAADKQSVVALGAEAEGRLAGFVLAHVLDGEFGGSAPVGVLDAVGVDPGSRRRGVARALTAALEKSLRGRGVREVRTEADWTEHDLVTFFSAAGFRLSPRLVLERGTESRLEHTTRPHDEAPEDEVSVRSMNEQDLASIVRLDRKITGRDRTPYYTRKAAEVLRQSGIRVSLVAEHHGDFAGFVMARVDLGEFGRTEPTAVLDTIGVDPAFAQRGVGRALLSQLFLNLGSLRVERVVTQAPWNNLDLLAFLARTGFERSQRLSFEKPIAV
jgi:ribosomal protein S18 acetylase RimI-like enzyme